RRRHTRFSRDWSSDVCSSDLPQCTPLATQAVHAAGTAHALDRRGADAVALCLIGDGATSEGDFHEGLNFAAVFNAPTVYLVQNRSEERRVGKESRSPWTAVHE